MLRDRAELAQGGDRRCSSAPADKASHGDLATMGRSVQAWDQINR